MEKHKTRTPPHFQQYRRTDFPQLPTSLSQKQVASRPVAPCWGGQGTMGGGYFGKASLPTLRPSLVGPPGGPGLCAMAPPARPQLTERFQCPAEGVGRQRRVRGLLRPSLAQPESLLEASRGHLQEGRTVHGSARPAPALQPRCSFSLYLRDIVAVTGEDSCNRNSRK